MALDSACLSKEVYCPQSGGFQEAIKVVFVIKNFEEDIANIFKRLLCLIIDRMSQVKEGLIRCY